MPEETEYLPTGQKDDGIEKMEENMGLGEKGEILDDLDKLEKKIDEVNKDMPIIMRHPLTTEQKIDMLNMIFPFHLGDRVRNKHSEDGIIESISIDPRGVLYLVGYKAHETHWEREDQINKISSYGGSEENEKEPFPFKTDVPDDAA